MTALLCLALIGCDSLPGGSLSAPVRFSPPPAGSFTTTTVRVSADGVSEPVPGAVVTRDFFPAVKLPPLLGREFVEGDWTGGASRLALLREDLWQRRFSGAPDIIGRTIDIDGTSVTIIGIMPRGFDAPAGTQLWLTPAAPI